MDKVDSTMHSLLLRADQSKCWSTVPCSSDLLSVDHDDFLVEKTGIDQVTCARCWSSLSISV